MRGHHFDDHVDHDHRGYDHYYIRRAISPLLVMGLYSDEDAYILSPLHIIYSLY